jgi:hypothetical protein
MRFFRNFEQLFDKIGLEKSFDEAKLGLVLVKKRGSCKIYTF